MSSNYASIEKRVIQAAEAALYRQKYVSPVDVFVGTGILQSAQVQDWRKGKIPYLEQAIQGSLGKISFTMKCFRLKEKLEQPPELTVLGETYESL